ncbi:hypothetical protein [Parasitella parasitica]|uniref:Serine/threonine-protein kinase ATR n=1 Tax=Parasitella parasitica TaxID=35722 RepID=A0A0B7NII2_9FUNG|nr:hypothetical protein [Parasitella parasitica]
MNESVEEFFENSLQEWKSIQEIQSLLNESLKAQISPEFCAGLVQPILLHAVNYPSTHNNPIVYGEMLCNLFGYLIEHQMVDNNPIFRDTTLMLVDTFQLHFNDKTKSALNINLNTQDTMKIMAITSHACCLMVELEDGVEFDSFCDLLWKIIPEFLTRLSTDLNTMAMMTITSMTRVGTRLLAANIIVLNDSTILALLSSLAALAVHHEVNDDLLNVIAGSMSQICVAAPQLEILHCSDLAEYTNILASILVNSVNLVLVKAMFDVSYLLARNNAPTPWLTDYISKHYDSPEITLLKENISLLQAVPYQDNYLTHFQDMTSIYSHHYSSAKDIIENLVSFGQESICQPYIKELTEFVTQLLFKDPDLAESIVNLIDYTIPNFLRKYIHFAMPYAILYNRDEDAIMGISSAFNTSTVDLCKDEAYHIILALLLEQDTETKSFGIKRLEDIIQEKDSLKKLATSNHTRLMASLAMNLGHPEQSKQYYNAVLDLKDIVRGKSSALCDYISSLIMAISEKISGYISQKRNQILPIQYPYALESLKAIMQLLESNINNHNLHAKMQAESLSLWKAYIELLDQNAIALHINSIVKGLSNILVVSPADVRLQVAHVLENLLIHGTGLTEEHYASLPVLLDFEELADVNKYVLEHQKSKIKNEIRKIVQDFSSFDSVQVLTSLEKLYKILVNHPGCRILVDKLYANLFNLLRKYNTHEMISYYAAICLGKLGAANPGLIKMDVIDQTVFVMRNFNNDDENLNYICDLIINHIFPSYNAIVDESTRHGIEYSIQTLVHIAGYRTIPEMKANAGLIRAYNHWRRHPRHIQEFLSPFLESAYQVAWPEIHIEYPIFVNSHSFKEWIKNWYCRMTKGAIGAAGRIFSACLPMVQYDMMDVALHLLPYLVLHTILSGSGDDVRAIIDELQSVLDMNANPTEDLERIQMNRYSLQVAVAVTEYCRKWLNRVNPNDLTLTSVVLRVNDFLRQIPDKDMGIAAFNAKAYPQALMHFETHLKEHSNNVLKDQDIMNYLRQIYIEIDDPIDYKALMDTYTVVTNRDEQIAQHVNLGEWDYAETLYKSKILDSPSDLSAYTGYLECLTKSNRFGSLLYEVENELADVPLWQPQINSFRIDAAWRVQDWKALNKGVHLPLERNAQALVGCALHQMRNNLPVELTRTIGEARMNLTSQITMNSTRSYRKSYPQLFNLQLLEELENAQQVWNAKDPVEEMKRFETRWDESLKRIMPRSQYSDSDKVKMVESNLWLDLARENRKMGNMVASLNALKHAEHLCGRELYYEMAKWYWKKGSVNEAIKLIKYHNQDSKFSWKDALLLSDIFIQNPNSFDAATTRQLFHSCLRSDPEKLEKANHNCSTYYLLRFPRSAPLTENKLMVQEYIMKTSSKALEHGSKYYYSSMSRLFNTYFDMEKQAKEAAKQPGTELNKKVMAHMNKINDLMAKVPDLIQPFQFTLFLTRLISHLSTDNEQIATCLQKIIKNCFVAYPRNTIWLVLGALDSDSPFVAKRMNIIFDLAKTQSPDNQILEVILQATAVKEALLELLKTPIDNEKGGESVDLNHSGYRNPFSNLQDLNLYMPNEASMLPTLPGHIKKNDTSLKPFPTDLPTIKHFESKITVMKSLQKPKRIKIMGSDGKTYSFLLKKEDDLRNDARIMEFFYMINYFLRKNAKSRDNDLYIRTFAILPMGTRWGLIEWIDNLNALKGIVSDYWEASGKHSVTAVAQKLNAQKLGLGVEKTKFFVEKILPVCPPEFYKWFLKNFPEPNQWLNSRTRYIKTLAVMSIVGHMVGLGDRHAENIMFDETNGDAVHVDLNLLFGKGTQLPVPELVPFRLTQNLVHAMGVLGTRGLFQATCETTLRVLLLNKDSLLSVFQTLLNELEATEVATPRISLRSSQKGTDKILKVLQQKFATKPEEINKEVSRLIKQATDNNNLAQMFPGM